MNLVSVIIYLICKDRHADKPRARDSERFSGGAVDRLFNRFAHIDLGQFHTLDREKLEHLRHFLRPLGGFLQHISYFGGVFYFFMFFTFELFMPGLTLRPQAVFPGGKFLAMGLPNGTLSVPKL